MKNYISDYFYNTSNNAVLNPQKIMTEETKNYFKNNVLQLMLSVESILLPNIIEMIKTVVQNANGYLIIWPKLMELIGDILIKHDPNKNVHLYDLISKLIKRYHIETRSAPLFKEIINTMKYICQPMTDDAQKIIAYLKNNNNIDENTMITSLKILNKIMSIFYSLNYQDFPEFFEDHLKEWIEILNDILVFPNNNSDMSKFQGKIIDLILKVKAKSLKNVNLYYTNYYEDVENYVQPFYNSAWTLMCQCKINDTFSKLMKELLNFFKAAFQMNRLNNLNQQQLMQIFDNIIYPNMKMTQKEIEEFEDNPIEFLKIDFEEYDMSSNKYFSINLMQIILERYPNVNKEIIFPKIQNLLSDYNSNKQKNWNSKLIAINLLFASCIKTFAQRLGVTELNPNSLFNNIDDLINEIFIKDFQNFNAPVIIQVYSLKFLSTFRQQINGKEKLTQVILMLIEILNKCENITQNACLLCLDLIINMKDIHSRQSPTADIINEDNIFNKLISTLITFIGKNINLFAMRCFFRTLKLTQDQKLQKLADSINSSMDTILKIIITQPQNDEFNYYFFETCALIMKKFTTNTQDITLIKKFEGTLRNDLSEILQKNITDLLAYTFQLFAFYLYKSNDNNSDFYINLLKTILTNDAMWDISMKYLYPPSIDFIKVILMTNKQYCDNKSIIDMIFKICKKLLENKSFEYVFKLVEYLINFVNSNLYGANLTELLKVTNSIAIQNQTTNPKVFNDINQEMIMFLAKSSIKININLSMEIIKTITSDPIKYLIDMIDEISNLKAISDKKLVVYWYVQIISNFYNSIDQNSLIIITFKLLNVLKNFYGISIRKYYDNNKNEDLSYAANNYNKLTCAGIEHQITAYKTAQECDENKIFFQAQLNIAQNKNFDFIKAALTNLKGKELDRMKSYIKQNEYPVS